MSEPTYRIAALYVCDRCGNLTEEAEDRMESWTCGNCGSEAGWAFDTDRRRDAEIHSLHVALVKSRAPEPQSLRVAP